MIILVALKRAGGVGIRWKQYSLLGAGVLGDSLGSLRDGVLGQLTGQEEPDSSLDLTGGDRGSLVVVSKTAGLSSDGSKRTDFLLHFLLETKRVWQISLY